MSLRNEVTVKIADQDCRLGYDMESLMEFEELAGVGLPYLTTLVVSLSSDCTKESGDVDGLKLTLEFSKHFKTKWGIAAVYCGLMGTPEQKTWKECMELCHEHGFARLATLFMTIYPVFMGRNEGKKQDEVDPNK